MTKYFASLLLFLVAWPSFAADQNGYTAKYECRAGNPNCNVDVATLVAQACQQTITTSTTPTNDWSAINWANTVICIEAGDHTARGLLTLGASGTAGTRKILRYVRTSDNNDDPWNQSDANKAKIADFECFEKDYWIIQRLTFWRTNGNEFFRNAGCKYMVYERMLVDGRDLNPTSTGKPLWLIKGIAPNYVSSDFTTVQNSVVRGSGKLTNADNPCINQGGPDVRIVNNEIYNCGGDAIVLDTGSRPYRSVMENNDLYQTIDYYINCDGTPATPGGNNHCSCGEDAIDLKSNDTTNPANGIEIIHNRMWGWRTTYQSCGGTGSFGFGVNSGSGDPKRYVQVRDNIIMDISNGISLSPPTSNWTVSGNILYDVSHAHTSQDFLANSDAENSVAIRFGGGSNHKVYLNTIANSKYALVLASSAANNLLQCNVFLNLQGIKRHFGENWASSSISTNNAFYATPAFTTTTSSNNIILPAVSDAKMSTYSFQRKLLTKPELMQLDFTRPSTSSPHYTACQLTLN